MIQFCEEAQKWTMKDTRNVIAIHCKGGKGRSGVMIAAFILWSGHRKSALDALELFTFRRTENYDPSLGLDGTYNHYIRRGPCNQTVEGPSQIRYVHYLEAVLYSGIEPFAVHKICISHMTMPVDILRAKTPWYLSYTVQCVRAPVFDSNNFSNELLHYGGHCGDTFVLPLDVVVWGDVRVQIFRHKNKNTNSSRKLIAFIIFNPAFYPDKHMIKFKKSKIDVMNKDKSNKSTTEDFSITLHISPEDAEQIRIEAEFREIFKLHGTRIQIPKGEWVIEEDEEAERILLITEGDVEGVVEETPDPSNVHPLGRSAAEACSLGKQGSDYTRVPNVCMLGVNTILGASLFLSQAPTMSFRARTNVVVYEIRKCHTQLSSRDTHDADHNHRSMSTRRNVTVDDVELPGISMDELAVFYRGVCITLGTQLSRVRMEAIRIGSLKQFNDRQTVLAEQDETERLRVACISTFGLPMNEKMTVRLKCSWKVGMSKPRRVRLMVFLNYLILDPEFFGPEIGVRSELIALRQLHSVAPARQANVIIVTLLGERVHGLDIAANTFDYELTFNDPSKTRFVYNLLSSMCRKAEETRERERIRPFETPLMSSLLENCSSVFRLKKGERLEEASSKSSLFLVRTGEIRLVTRNGQVFRLVREGSCFGEINFALNSTAGHYDAFANTSSIVLEIGQQGQLQRTLAEDSALAARFYCIASQVIEKELRETIEETFPGSWSKKVSSYGRDEDTLQHKRTIDREKREQLRSMQAGSDGGERHYSTRTSTPNSPHRYTTLNLPSDEIRNGAGTPVSQRYRPLNLPPSEQEIGLAD